jgi:hypothetical protein
LVDFARRRLNGCHDNVRGGEQPLPCQVWVI